jgi:hypothetical protein
MGFGEVLRLLGERETACRAQADRLEVEQERIVGLLADCRVELERLVVAREVVAGLTVAPAVPVVVASAVPVVVASAGGGMPGVENTEFGQRLLAVLAGHAGLMRCRDVVAALGEDPSVARHVERARHRLKKLTAAGLVAEPEPGMFTRAGGRDTATG